MKIEIQVKNQKWTLWAAFFAAVLFLGIMINVFIFDGDWFSLFYLYLPPFYIYLYYNYKKNMIGRYMQWDDDFLEYYMPYQKNKIKLHWNEIDKIEIDVLSIEILLKHHSGKIDLDAVNYEVIRSIKMELPKQFDKIKSGTAAKSC
ncbi:MAG: hypothetical protein ACOCXH_03485 [Cyclobacteriaceae bacterium]